MVSKMPGKTLPLSGTKHHPLFKLHYPARFDPLAEYSQPEANTFLPPRCAIWKSPVMSSWGIDHPPHKKKTEPWAKHKSNVTHALRALLQFAWDTFLRDEGGLPRSDCPIEGIF